MLSNRTRMSISPVIAGAETNMTIYTGRRTISLAITEGHSRNPTYRLALKYPETVTARASRTVAGSSREIGYAWSGDTSLKPAHIWNDGQATHFAFAPDLRPSIFGVDPNGRDVTLISRTRGSIVRVPRLRSAYSVRVGTEVLCIVRVVGGVTADAGLINKLHGWEF